MDEEMFQEMINIFEKKKKKTQLVFVIPLQIINSVLSFNDSKQMHFGDNEMCIRYMIFLTFCASIRRFW